MLPTSSRKKTPLNWLQVRKQLLRQRVTKAPSPPATHSGPHAGKPCKPGYTPKNSGCIPKNKPKNSLPGSQSSPASTPKTPSSGGKVTPADVKAKIDKFVAAQDKTPAALSSVIDDMMKLTIGDIKGIVKQLGIKTNLQMGTKARLADKIARIALEQVASTPSSTSPTPAATPTPSSLLPVVPYKAETDWETGKPQPGTLNGVDFAPAPKKFWEKVKDVDVGEPKPTTPVKRAGIMIQEPDGRIWIVQPTNGFGNRKYTLPGGGVEPGLTDQQNALKEVWEETGLQVEITGYAGDFEDSNNGNNGRLYVGKRVGGAPWDAKVESFITNHKTGQPAAESEKITLVTPEQAAKLLHRSDDLAQLMVVAPPPLDTPTRGKGSEPLKKFLKGLQPAVEAYKDKKVKEAKKKDPYASASSVVTGNAELHAVQDMRGFNKKPKVVAKKDFDALVKQGDHIEMLRGLKSIYGGDSASDLADQYRDGDNFAGYGIFGSGTYADSNKGSSNVSSQYAGNNYGGSGGAVLRMALPKSAKIIKESELEKLVPQHPDLFKGYQGTGGKLPKECWMGVQAALAGYDAIEVDGKSTSHYSYGKGFYVVLNRSIVTVQKEDATGHTIQ